MDFIEKELNYVENYFKKLQKEKADILKRAEEKGKQQKSIEVAQNLYREGHDIHFIKKVLGLSNEQLMDIISTDMLLNNSQQNMNDKAQENLLDPLLTLDADDMLFIDNILSRKTDFNDRTVQNSSLINAQQNMNYIDYDPQENLLDAGLTLDEVDMVSLNNILYGKTDFNDGIVQSSSSINHQQNMNYIDYDPEENLLDPALTLDANDMLWLDNILYGKTDSNDGIVKSNSSIGHEQNMKHIDSSLTLNVKNILVVGNILSEKSDSNDRSVQSSCEINFQQNVGSNYQEETTLKLNNQQGLLKYENNEVTSGVIINPKELTLIDALNLDLSKTYYIDYGSYHENHD